MKYRLLVLTIFSFSCKTKPKELLRFVNDQNDGWNAFNIVIHEDSSYTKSEFISDQNGLYSIKNDTVSFKTGPLKNYKLVLTKDSTGHVLKAVLIYQNQTTAMRTISDSLFFQNAIHH